MDESWLELDERTPLSEAQQIADILRIEIMYALGLSVSVGVSFNYIFSKLGSDLNKPNGIAVISKDSYKQIAWPLPAEKLLFVGNARKKVLSDVGINTIGNIAQAEPQRLIKLLGKVGYDLWRFANGDDKNFKPNSDEIGSVGNTITPPADLHNDEEVSAVIYMLASAISTRLMKHNLKTRCVSICTRDSGFDKVIRQCRLNYPTDNPVRIFNSAYELFTAHYRWDKPLRSIGVRVDNLAVDNQMSLFEQDDCELNMDIDSRIKSLTQKFGKLEFEKTATTREW
jgi:DNA polymerase-4